MENKGFGAETIFIIEENCQGCNKCIRNCPVFGANVSYTIDGATKVRVNPKMCIHCGKCIDVCDHNARDYRDDTERFFQDLQQGKEISVLVAPAARANFPEYKRVIGYLKEAGAHLVYDVSFGADITVWAYLKVMAEKGVSSIIAQPCPVIVNYVEKHNPVLLDYLAPVHSPMLCAAIYLRKYQGCRDRLAFLSPCIGKSDEIRDTNTEKIVTYNVTFKKLNAYLTMKGINLNEYPEREFDDPGCGLGYVFPRPGGLRENVQAIAGKIWIRQVEGQEEAYHYLHEYRRRLERGKKLPPLVDILNCPYGCNKGTGTNQEVDLDDIDLAMEAFAQEKSADEKSRKLKNSSAKLFKIFNKELKLDDFYRRYKKVEVQPLMEPTPEEYAAIFLKLHKDTPDSQKINCSACGYQTCHEMARAIFNQLDRPEDCMDYNRKEVIRENLRLEEKNREIERMLAEITQLSDERQQRAAELTRRIHEITISMEQVYRGNEQAAQEIEKIGSDVGEVAEYAERLRKLVAEINDNVDRFTEATGDILGVARQTKILSLNAGIEAARSGEHGKGFNVLAQEIKRLAEESQNTAEEALGNEEAIQVLVVKVFEISNTIDQKMAAVNMAIKNIAAIIQEFIAQGEEMVAATTNIVHDYTRNQD
ncbi:MAG TPA: 4Fe-4S dicluster domain-containing protein [Firmicutes bacterium]|nr:4Fe-4S dicluster domain-containing protein [Bacillota bacterium]